MASNQFPDGFVWGAATAAAQIEGAASSDGKGQSIWDHFATLPGKIKNGDTPEVACDHYHRYEADFDLLVSLGITHYRLSIAWPSHRSRRRRIDQRGRPGILFSVDRRSPGPRHYSLGHALSLGPAASAGRPGRLVGAANGRGLRPLRRCCCEAPG